MRTHTTVLMLTAIIGLSASSLGDRDEQEVPLDDLPQVVKDAALDAVEGITLTEAELETHKDGTKVYEVEGTADGKEYEIKITEAGKVLAIEVEDEDDEEDEDN